MGLRALVRRCTKASDLCENSIGKDQIDPNWEQVGCETGIPADSPGWQTRNVTFPEAFALAPNFLLASISNTNPCVPSGLKAFVYPCDITVAGFTMNVDINISCAVSSTTIDVCYLARRI